MRWEGKGWGAGVLRGQEKGEKCKTLMFVIFISVLAYFQIKNPNMLFDLRLVSSETSETISKRRFALGLKTGLLPEQL